MGRPRKLLGLGTLWHEAVVADFTARHPHGMYRPVDADADPRARIEAMPWWANRPALILIGCTEPSWTEDALLAWTEAAALAADTRSAVIEIACPASGAETDVDFSRLAAGFRCRRHPDKALTLARRDASDPLAYFHVVREARTRLDSF